MNYPRHANTTSVFCAVRILGGLTALLSGGCAVRYYDAKSGTEHVWGLAHVKMRVASPAGESSAVATQVESLGLGLGFGASDSSAHLGWGRSTRLRIPDDTAFSLEWPTTDLFDVRVGDRPPFLSAPSDSAPSQPTPLP